MVRSGKYSQKLYKSVQFVGYLWNISGILVMNGEYRNTIDEKGRIVIPPSLREQLGGEVQFKLTKSLDGNALWLFKKGDFESIERAVNSDPLAIFNTNTLRLNRLVISPARNVELDKTGRLAVPKELRDAACLEAKMECVILGAMNYIEISSATKYDAYVKEEQGKLLQSGNELSLQRMNS